MNIRGNQSVVGEVSGSKRELLFIAPDVEDQATLLAAVRPGIAVFALREGRDGILQIADVLEHHDEIDHLHIVSHGRPGEVILPGASLNSESMATYAEPLSRISRGLAKDASICLYGCNIAADQGRRFIAELSDAVGAGVSASERLTGATELGGDWNLEVAVGGAARADIAFSRQEIGSYPHVLVYSFSLPSVGTYTDTYLYDDFPRTAGFVSAISDVNPNAAMKYSIVIFNNSTGLFDAVPNDNVTSTYTFSWGVLSLDMASGAFVFDPNDTFINSLAGIIGGSFGNATESSSLQATTGIYIQATDTTNNAFEVSLNQIGFASPGVNDNPGKVPGAPNVGAVASVGVAFNYVFPVDAQFLRVDQTNTGAPGSGVTPSDRNVLAYSVYRGTDESLFTSTQTDDTTAENNAYKASATAVPSWLVVTTPANTTNAANPATLTFSGTPGAGDVGILDLMVVATDSPIQISVNRHVGEHFVIYVGSAGNDAPYINSGTTFSAAENQTAVATITALDPDAGATLTYSIVGGADQAFFTIDPSTGALGFVSSRNFESPQDAGANNVYDVVVRATDNNGLTDDETVAVSVTNVNEFAPVITSNGGGATAAVSVASGVTAVTTVTSTDADSGATKAFYLGGKDMARFTINASSGALAFASAPNFAAPSDAGGNNVYDIIVMAFDGATYDTQAIAVTVTSGGNSAPTITSNGGGATAAISIPENSVAVTDVNATDPDPGTTLTYSLNGGADVAKFSINSSTGELSFIQAPNFESPTDAGGNNVYDVIVRVSDSVAVDDQTIAVTVTNVAEGGIKPPSHHFDAGGTSDILWRNATNGALYAYNMNGVAIQSEGYVVPTGPAGWQVIESRADYSGDGKSDVLWHNAGTNSVYMYVMNGAAIQSESFVAQNVPTGWNILGTQGDYDGNGKADILWKNTNTNATYIYLMNGAAISGEGYERSGIGAGWGVGESSGDYNGDGKSDILWQNSITGALYIDHLSGTSILSEGFVIPTGPAGWQVISGKSDLNGDGRSDILWHNAGTNSVYAYLMNGNTIQSEGYVSQNVPTGWVILETKGDYNADGKSDILWKNTVSNATYIYLMNGLSIQGQGYERLGIGAGWEVADAVGDFNADGNSDILWRNAGSGGVYLDLISGTSIQSEGYVRTGVVSDWSVI